MLGMSGSEVLYGLLNAMVDGNASRMIAIADEMQAQSLSFAQAMRDIAGALHRIALLQRVPTAIDSADPDYASLSALASSMSPEEVQLDYQIALHGRNDMGLAPDEYAGFTMALLRMLAFKPAGSRSNVQARGSVESPAESLPRGGVAAVGSGSGLPPLPRPAMGFAPRRGDEGVVNGSHGSVSSVAPKSTSSREELPPWGEPAAG